MTRKIKTINKILCSLDGEEYNDELSIEERLDLVLKRIGNLQNCKRNDYDTMTQEWADICNQSANIGDPEERATFYEQRFSEAQNKVFSLEHQRKLLMEILFDFSNDNNCGTKLANALKEQIDLTEKFFLCYQSTNHFQTGKSGYV